MKLLAATFGGIALLAGLLGFAMDVAPFLAACGKVIALMALGGLAFTAGANEAEATGPLFDFELDDAQL